MKNGFQNEIQFQSGNENENENRNEFRFGNENQIGNETRNGNELGFRNGNELEMNSGNELGGQKTMSLKNQQKNRRLNHKQMYGKPYFSIFRCNSKYPNRHLYSKNCHKGLNTNLYGTDFVYGATRATSAKENFIRGG